MMVSIKFTLCDSILDQLENLHLTIVGKIFNEITNNLMGYLYIDPNDETKQSGQIFCGLENGICSPKKRSSFPNVNAQKSKTVKLNCQKPLPTKDIVVNRFETTSKADPDALVHATQNLATGDKVFECSVCLYRSGNRGHVKRHIDIKHLPNSSVFKCRMCEVTCSLRYNLKSHYIKVHNMPDDAAKAMLG